MSDSDHSTVVSNRESDPQSTRPTKPQADRESDNGSVFADPATNPYKIQLPQSDTDSNHSGVEDGNIEGTVKADKGSSHTEDSSSDSSDTSDGSDTSDDDESDSGEHGNSRAQLPDPDKQIQMHKHDASGSAEERSSRKGEREDTSDESAPRAGTEDVHSGSVHSGSDSGDSDDSGRRGERGQRNASEGSIHSGTVEQEAGMTGDVQIQRKGTGEDTAGNQGQNIRESQQIAADVDNDSRDIDDKNSADNGDLVGEKSNTSHSSDSSSSSSSSEEEEEEVGGERKVCQDDKNNLKEEEQTITDTLLQGGEQTVSDGDGMESQSQHSNDDADQRSVGSSVNGEGRPAHTVTAQGGGLVVTDDDKVPTGGSAELTAQGTSGAKSEIQTNSPGETGQEKNKKRRKRGKQRTGDNDTLCVLTFVCDSWSFQLVPKCI